jgi:hypothetical protein
MEQQRDEWCSSMSKVVKWSMAGASATSLQEHGILAFDMTTVKREAEYFSVTDDSVLLHLREERHVLPGEPAATVVLPQSQAVPPALAPNGKYDERWTWWRWALYHAHTMLTGGHMRYEKALPRSRAWA